MVTMASRIHATRAGRASNGSRSPGIAVSSEGRERPLGARFSRKHKGNRAVMP